MDIATIVGLISAFLLVALAVIVGGQPQVFIDPPSLPIVFCGTAATTFVRFPAARVKRTVSVVKNAFSFALRTPEDLIEELVELCKTSRQKGFLSLDDYQTDDAFLKQGIQLVVDGTGEEAVQQILSLDIAHLQRRHREGQEVLKAIAETAPAFGMIGTLIGLIMMLANMDDVSSLGPAMATAITTTLYGALVATLAATPLAKKLEIRSQEETLNRELTLEGLLNLLRGENSQILESVLGAFLARKELGESAAEEPEAKAA